MVNGRWLVTSLRNAQTLLGRVGDITETSDQVFALLRARNVERHTAFLIVTHNPALARRCDRVIELVDGAVVYEGPPSGIKTLD